MLAQKSYFSFGLNYSWMEKIESSLPSSQILSPGFSVSYGKIYPLSEYMNFYSQANLNWLSGGIAWELPNSDIRIKSNFNNLRFEFENGFVFKTQSTVHFCFGFTNSFGAKLESNFNQSNQHLFRNWSPLMLTKWIYKRNENSNWACSLKVAFGLRTISYIQSNSSGLNLRYESSNNHAAIEIIRLLR